MKQIIGKFTTHPAKGGENYFQHLKFASNTFIRLIKMAVALLIHGFIPSIFENYTSNKVKELELELIKRNPLKKSSIVNSILDLIGNTPMLRLTRFNPNLKCNLFAKCEMFNPTLSVKDRIVLFMLRKHEESGNLKSGVTIYEASSGNTGSSLAMIASVLGYHAVITVPHKTSQEKINTMRAYGAKVIVCKEGIKSDSPEHYTNMARILSEQDSGSLYLNQYGDENNVCAHACYTAEEIWQQTGGKIDYLIAPASSGGTITGIGKFLKQKNPDIKIILPDPIGSVFYDYFYGNELMPQSYGVEGAGKDKICNIHDFNVIDEVIKFTDEEAYATAKRLALTEGVLSGGSSGGALFVAEKIASMIQDGNTLNIVVMFPDSGFKYLSKFYQTIENIN